MLRLGGKNAQGACVTFLNLILMLSNPEELKLVS